jgi:hypothetical protein
MKKNKTIYLMGGSGNVFFQINYGYFLIEKGYKVKFSTILISSNKIINRLLNWSDHETLSFLNSLGMGKKIELVDGSIMTLAMLFVSKMIKKPFFGYCFDGSSRARVNEECCKVHLGYYYDRVPISIGFVSDIRELSRNYIENKNSDFLKKINKLSKAFVIHYRAGDFLLQQDLKLSDLYYTKVLKNKGNTYLISNNKNYSLTYLSSLTSQRIEFIGDKTALDDFILLMHSSNMILSNSTFSWWAAECSNADKIYQPDPFFPHIVWNPMTNKARIKIQY